MNVKRGDIVLAYFPNASGTGGKMRPVLVVQSDVYNRKIDNVLVAEITSNLTHAADPAHLLLDVSTPDGQATGLLRNSLISCINLATVREDRVVRVIGSLSAVLLQRCEACLKTAMDLS
jgi:mRNA interferase MazF